MRRIPEPWRSLSGAVVATAVLLALGWQKPEAAIGFLGTFVGLKAFMNWRRQREDQYEGVEKWGDLGVWARVKLVTHGQNQNESGEQWRGMTSWERVKVVTIWLLICAGLALVLPLVAFFVYGLLCYVVGFVLGFSSSLAAGGPYATVVPPALRVLLPVLAASLVVIPILIFRKKK